MEVPDWELGETVTPSPHHPIGAKGVGESANVGSPPAVVNAVVDALEPFGVRHLDMPVHAGARVGGDAGRRDGAAAVSARAAELEAAGVAVRRGDGRALRARRPARGRATARSCSATGRSRASSAARAPTRTVRLQALRALETGEPVLLRILPGDGGRARREEPARSSSPTRA